MKRILFFIPVLVLLIINQNCMDQSRSNIPGSDELFVEWEFLGNSGRQFGAVFTIDNRSRVPLGNSGWAMYYNQSGRTLIEGSISADVSMEHINGELWKMSPGKDFLLEPGEKTMIRYDTRGRLIKEAAAPLGPYFVFTDSAGKELAAVAVDNYTIRDFPELDRIFLPESGIPLPDAAWVFGENKPLSLMAGGEVSGIIPAPVSLKTGEGKLVLGEGLMIHRGEGLENEADYLAGMLASLMGNKPAVMGSAQGGPNIILLRQEKVDVDGKTLNSYTLEAGPETGVVITGSDPAGVFYGIQSLLALVPVRYFAEPSGEIELGSFTISDAPDFSYRGMHLDLARNYNRPETVKKMIRIMAFYKLNKLHLHLTDDEGWRLEIEELPELTRVGGYRGHTLDNMDHLIPAYGSGPEPDPEVSWGSGFLSREEFIDLLTFADRHHVEVIPEINMPGHSRAAIYAMESRYKRLVAEGKEEEAEQYRLIDPDDSSRYNSAQNYNDNVVCVCREAPYLFFKTVLDDVIEMYREAGLELRVIHTGGDEVPRGVWEGSPVCREFLENNPGIGSAGNLQAYFSNRLVRIIRERGLVVAGWEEIAMKMLEEGGWIPNPEMIDKQVLPYVWNSIRGNMDLGYKLANAGYPVILCNVNNLYFDMAYNHHPAEPGLYWGGFVDTRKVFEFIPYDIYKSTMEDTWGNPYDEEDFKGLERLRPEAMGNILGLQGELWSETVKGEDMLEYLYLPKMLGLAERAWSGQAEWGNMEDTGQRMEAMYRDMNRFFNLAAQQEMPRLDHIFGGFNYRLPPPGAVLKDGLLYANTNFPGITIRYTTDGLEPDSGSPLYTEPVAVSGEVMLRSFDSRGRGSRISVIHTSGH
jgi:hexosaminidase